MLSTGVRHRQATFRCAIQSEHPSAFEPQRRGQTPGLRARIAVRGGFLGTSRTGMTLRVTHAPVNVAGIPWENVQAQRRKGVDARLVVFNRGKLHPEADISLDRHGALPRRLATQFAALGRLLPSTDVFHFYFGLTLVPPSLQFPILKRLARRASSTISAPTSAASVPTSCGTASVRAQRSSAPTRPSAGSLRPVSSRRGSSSASSPRFLRPTTRSRSSCTPPRTARRRAPAT